MIDEKIIKDAKEIFEETNDLNKALDEFCGYGDEPAIMKFLNSVVDLVYSRFYFEFGAKHIEGYYSDENGEFIDFEHSFG